MGARSDNIIFTPTNLLRVRVIWVTVRVMWVMWVIWVICVRVSVRVRVIWVRLRDGE